MLGSTPKSSGPPPIPPAVAGNYCDRISPLRLSRVLIQGLVTAALAMGIATWRLRSGLALIGDSGSYLAGASGLSDGRFFQTPLVPSFSELPLLDTARSSGWSPYADFGIGLPIVIALFDIAFPLTTAAELVNVISIGLIALGVVIGPWSPRHHGEMWLRSTLGIVLCCWPILRFTSIGVLSELLFCAALLWLAILMARTSSSGTVSSRTTWLIGVSALTMFIGTLRFVGPIVAVVVAILLYQRGLRPRSTLVWGFITAIVPLAATVIATRGSGTRALTLHPLDSSDIFFTARGVGGWFEAGLGDQTSTFFRTSFQPSVTDWLICVCAATATVMAIRTWIHRIRERSSSPLEPAVVLAVTLAVAVIPSMVFIDAVVKLENRTLMPSGLLVICAAGWWLGRNTNTRLDWGVLIAWTIVATQPWNWFDRPQAPAPTALTDAVRAVDPSYVVTNLADLVWWITDIPARYLPDGYHDLSDRTFDPFEILKALPCALVQTGGAVVIETPTMKPEIIEHLMGDVDAGEYELREMSAGVAAFMPTGQDC